MQNVKKSKHGISWKSDYGIRCVWAKHLRSESYILWLRAVCTTYNAGDQNPSWRIVVKWSPNVNCERRIGKVQLMPLITNNRIMTDYCLQLCIHAGCAILTCNCFLNRWKFPHFMQMYEIGIHIGTYIFYNFHIHISNTENWHFQC